jgi:hypothetical protein
LIYGETDTIIDRYGIKQLHRKREKRNLWKIIITKATGGCLGRVPGRLLLSYW